MKNIIISRPFFLLTLFGLIGLATMAYSALSGEQTTSQITEITLQRTACYGFCSVDKVTLKSDGTAEFTGNVHTAQIGDFKGTVDKYSFSKLAQWLESQNIFEMKDSYGEQNVDVFDGIISVVKNNQRKTIVNHGLGSSLKIWGMEQAIIGVASDIKWQPVQSGIRGSCVYRPKGSPESRPISSSMMIFTPDNSESFRFDAGKDGKFQIPLSPGTYIVRMFFPDNSQTIVVKPNKFSDVKFVIHKQEK